MDGLSMLMNEKIIPTDPQEFEIYLREKYPELRVVRGFSTLYQAVLQQDLLTREEQVMLGRVLELRTN